MHFSEKNEQNREELEKLLEIHSKKIGLDPNKVKDQLQIGIFDKDLKALNTINLNDSSIEIFLNDDKTKAEIFKMMNQLEEGE